MPKRQYNHKLTRFAMELRRNSTPQEKKLWFGFLRHHPLRFVRQRSFGEYIVDFYCGAANLVIEIDGNQHCENRDYDLKRTSYLNKQGISVLRFGNAAVNNNFEGVCKEINFVLDYLTGSDFIPEFEKKRNEPFPQDKNEMWFYSSL